MDPDHEEQPYIDLPPPDYYESQCRNLLSESLKPGFKDVWRNYSHDENPEEAQAIVDYLSKVYYDELKSPQRHEPQQILSALRAVAKKARVFPKGCELHGIECDFRWPKAGGGFGDIWQGTYKDYPVCLKTVRSSILKPENLPELQDQAKEFALWAHLLHPNVLTFYGVHQPDPEYPRLCIVSPWMPQGDMEHYLRSFPQTSLDLRKLFLLDVSAGLKYLHENGVIHADLKARNVLISESNRAVIADFGISLIESGFSTSYRDKQCPYRWNAPELSALPGTIVPRTLIPSKESDIWSLGCLGFMALTGKEPYYQYPRQIQVSIALDTTITPLDKLDPEIANLVEPSMHSILRQCWARQPSNRLTAEMVHKRLQRVCTRDDRSTISADDLLHEITVARSNVTINYGQAQAALQKICHAAQASASDERTGTSIDSTPTINDIAQNITLKESCNTASTSNSPNSQSLPQATGNFLVSTHQHSGSKTATHEENLTNQLASLILTTPSSSQTSVPALPPKPDALRQRMVTSGSVSTAPYPPPPPPPLPVQPRLHNVTYPGSAPLNSTSPASRPSIQTLHPELHPLRLPSVTSTTVSAAPASSLSSSPMSSTSNNYPPLAVPQGLYPANPSLAATLGDDMVRNRDQSESGGTPWLDVDQFVTEPPASSHLQRPALQHQQPGPLNQTAPGFQPPKAFQGTRPYSQLAIAHGSAHNHGQSQTLPPRAPPTLQDVHTTHWPNPSFQNQVHHATDDSIYITSPSDGPTAWVPIIPGVNDSVPSAPTQRQGSLDMPLDPLAQRVIDAAGVRNAFYNYFYKDQQRGPSAPNAAYFPSVDGTASHQSSMSVSVPPPPPHSGNSTLSPQQYSAFPHQTQMNASSSSPEQQTGHHSPLSQHPLGYPSRSAPVNAPYPLHPPHTVNHSSTLQYPTSNSPQGPGGEEYRSQSELPRPRQTTY